MDEATILFFVDENLARHSVSEVLIARGHRVFHPERGEKDPAILAAAEASGAVIVTSDRHIYNALRRKKPYDKGTYRKAGVVVVPGYERHVTEGLIRRWLPMIEGVWLATRDGEDQRVVIDLRGGYIHIDQ